MIRVVLTAVALVALGLLLAPAGLAVPPDDRDGLRGPGALVAYDVSARPDDRAGIRGPGPAQIETPVVAAADGFDWRDAGIGVAGGLALALVAAALAATTAQRHRAQRLA